MTQQFMLGWEEWLALPDLGLAAIKAKVDTGARTSSLHAYSIETFGSAERPKVRFSVHPIPGRDAVSVVCTADIVDRREVTSSNGETESRYVIRTPVAIGSRTWPIEITLANRETMAYRMLLGRTALQDDMFVDPTASFRQPKLSYKVYGPRLQAGPGQKPLHLALMTRRPDNASVRRIVRAAERRGHTVTLMDRSRLSLYIATDHPAIYLDGRPLETIDAVLVRSGGALSSFSLAALRQLELLGAFAVNPADALARLADVLAVRQSLARAGLAIPDTAASDANLLKPGKARDHVLAETGELLGGGPVQRHAVLLGRAVAAIERDASTSLDDEPEWRAVSGPGSGASRDASDGARRLAEAVAKTLGLGLAAVDISLSRQGPVAIGVSGSLPIAQIDRICGTALAEAIVIQIEQEVRNRAPRAGSVC